MVENFRNWGGNLTYSTDRLHYPETVAQIRELVGHAKKMRVLGSRHSFNRIADTTEDLISLERLEQSVTVDHERRTATVTGGMKYGQLCEQLHRAGYGLPNLASLPHISIAGACATATHGSGNGNGNLATVVSAMELVTASGELVSVSREQQGEQFQGMVVGLGGLGVVTKLTLDLVPTFIMYQEVYNKLPLAQLEAHFDAIVASAYSVSIFTDWQGEQVNQIWTKHRDGERPRLAIERLGATLATAPQHPIASIAALPCTEQMGRPGPWHERLPHFRMAFTPSSGEELQSEYFVPRQHALEAIRSIYEIGAQIGPLLMISELRTIAADNLWMSPCYQQDCVALHFTWKQDWAAVRQVLPLIEAQLAPFDARPHWGKLFTMRPEHLRARYPRLPEFQRLLHDYDSQGKFRNAFLDTYIFG